MWYNTRYTALNINTNNFNKSTLSTLLSVFGNSSQVKLIIVKLISVKLIIIIIIIIIKLTIHTDEMHYLKTEIVFAAEVYADGHPEQSWSNMWATLLRLDYTSLPTDKKNKIHSMLHKYNV